MQRNIEIEFNYSKSHKLEYCYQRNEKSCGIVTVIKIYLSWISKINLQAKKIRMGGFIERNGSTS